MSATQEKANLSVAVPPAPPAPPGPPQTAQAPPGMQGVMPPGWAAVHPGYTPAMPMQMGVPGAPMPMGVPGAPVPAAGVPAVNIGGKRAPMKRVSGPKEAPKEAPKMDGGAQGPMDMSALIPWGNGPLLPASAEKLMMFSNPEARRPALAIGLPRDGHPPPFVRARAVRGGRLYFTAEEVVDGLVMHAPPPPWRQPRGKSMVS